MFRENVLTNDAVLDRIATTMVPVAVDRWKAEDPGTREAKFLQPFFEKHPPQGSPCIYAPDGKVLGAFRGYGDMARKTLELIDSALKRFGPVEPRAVRAVETQPHRGRGVLPDGSVQLAEIIRPSDESLRFLNTRTPVISSVTLSAREFKAFVPPQAKAGARWTLPDEVARKLARITSPLCYQHAPRPDWVTAVRVSAEVVRIHDGAAAIRYRGSIASRHRVGGQTVSRQEAIFSGEGVHDLASRKLRSLLLVGSGELRWPEAPEKLVEFDLLVEWTLAEAAGKRPAS